MTLDLLPLRPYQREAVDAVHAAHAAGIRRPAFVLPTGGGKTVVFSHLASEYLRDQGRRVLVLVHRDELADQAIAKLRAVMPLRSIGKVKAQDNDVSADIVVASVQTLARASRRQTLLLSGMDYMIPEFGLIITDECHHAAAVSYKLIYEDFPDAVHVGFTATMARGDGVGLGSVWEEVVYSRSILHMVADGHLVDVRGTSVALDDLDLRNVKSSGGDYSAGSLGLALEVAGAPEIIAQAMKRHADGRRSIVFTPTVAMAEATAQALMSTGITCAVVSGATPREERLKAYDAFRIGLIQALVNCMVLTEGFDAPWSDCAVIARPTQSAPLFVQMVGRVLRTWPGKGDALVLDLTGVGGKLSTLVDLAPGQVKSLRPGESLAEAAVREEEEGNQKIKSGSLAFALTHQDMDLFAASSNNWVTTPKGVMAIPCAERQWVFLWPCQSDRSLWDVCLVDPGKPWQRLKECLPVGTAQAWAEKEADDRAGYGTHRGASWSRKRASDAQLDKLRRMGQLVNPTMRAGDAAHMINVNLATRTFDQYVRTVE